MGNKVWIKEELSSLDVFYLLKELKKDLVGARLQKFYQSGDTLIIQLHIPNKGTNELLFSLKHIALTKYKIERPQIPSNFAMALRKYLKGKRIKDITQVDFDRIIVLETEQYDLVLEMFSNGNIIFKDKENHIWSLMRKQVWSGRELKIHKEYKYPPLHINPFVSETEFFNIMKDMDKEKSLKSVLVNDFSFGPVYSNEIFLELGIDKEKSLGALDEEEIKKLYSVINELKNKELNPCIVIDKNGKYVDVCPVKLKEYDLNKWEIKKYDDFNDAVDDYFIRFYENREQKGALTAKDKYSLKDRLEFRLKSQIKKKQDLEKKMKEMNEIGTMILEEYSKLDLLLRSVEEKGAGILKDLDYIKNVDFKEKSFDIKINGKYIKLFYDLNVGRNSERYFDEAKKLKNKLKGLEDAIKETEKLIREAPEEEVETKKVVVKKKEKKKWYEKFNYIFTSKGLLCVIGKDATSNEVLIKKYMEKNDLVIHSDITGSPFGLLKEGRKYDLKEIEDDMKECSQFVGCRSRAWKTGAGNVEVYWVYPEQVTKKTKSGEYMGKGSFMVYGDRHYNKMDLKYAIGFYDKKILCGPEEMVKKKTNIFVLLTPGKEKAKDLSKKIRAELYEKADKKSREVIRTLNLGDISECIPFGVGEIVKR